MEWHIMNVGGLSSVGGSLGSLEDGQFFPSDECQDTLNEITQQLNKENVALCHIRKQIFYSGLVEKDLIPMIKHLRDEPEIFAAFMRLMSSLTQPIECLLNQLSHVQIEYQWQREIQMSLRHYRKLSCDLNFIQAISIEIGTILDESQGYDISKENCYTINDMLLFLRNILHYSEDKQANDDANKEFLRVLFETEMMNVILKLLQFKERESWCVTLVQLISLLYKGKIGELLYRNFNGSNTEEDMDDLLTEVECSMCGLEQKYGSCMCLKMLEQDFSHPSQFMDFSKAMESSSSDSSQHRGQGSQPKGENSLGDPEDVLWKWLEEFTQHFFSQGFCNLVNDLMQILVPGNRDKLDDAYFLWIIAFFHKLARYKRVSFQTIKSLYSVDIISFLVYKGVLYTEEVMFSLKQNINLSRKLRRLHLTVTALRELLLGLRIYTEDPSLSEEDIKYLENLQMKLAKLYDLRQFFLLLIRHFQSNVHSIKFLQEIVVTNHIYLLMIDAWNNKGFCSQEFSMVKHVNQFATVEVMQKYSRLLENFDLNNSLVNNCVFTMMHHVAGDCEHPESLFQIQTLTTFLHIWDTGSYITQEMNDLMDFVLERFMLSAESDPLSCARQLFGGSNHLHQQPMEESSSSSSRSAAFKKSVAEMMRTEWTLEEEDDLFLFYMELKDEASMISKISERFSDLGSVKTEQEISDQLHTLNLITPRESSRMSTDAMSEKSYDEESSSMEDNTEPDFDPSNMKESEVVLVCVQKLEEAGFKHHLEWLKRQLCEIAFAKFVVAQSPPEKKDVMEPMALYSAVQHKSIPLVLFSEEQESLLHNQYFNTLLQYLGLHMPNDVNMLFPRVPHFWGIRQAVDKAASISLVSKDDLKFDLENLKEPSDMEVYSSLPDDQIECSSLLMERFNGQEKRIPSFSWMNMVQSYNKSSGQNGIMSLVE